jgi:hypothetical protein
MFIYINGIGASASEYTSVNFNHTGNIEFNSKGSTIYLHSFRVYNKALTPDKIVNNWIADMAVSDKINADHKNDIYGSGDTIQNQKIMDRIPYMIITTPKLPESKGDKKNNVHIEFHGTEGKLYDFTLQDA